MKGYFAFPPSAATATATATTLSNTDTSVTSVEHTTEIGNVEDTRQRRREHERALGEHSEREWVRAGGVLRDASGRRDMIRTERIRQELDLQEAERRREARWDAYEARWSAMQSSTEPITFVDFPWLLGERVSSRDLAQLSRCAVSGFLFESLAVRSNTTTKRERIRSALLRWHPDKTAVFLSRVVPDDVELVREGIHLVFGILKHLQDTERTGLPSSMA